MEPVDLADMKTFLRVDTTLDDDLITGLITASRTWCEDYTQRRFINQQWRLGFNFSRDRFSGRRLDQYSRPVLVGPTAVFAGFQYAILLPYPPAVSVDSFTWKDQNGLPNLSADNQLHARSCYATGAAYSALWSNLANRPNHRERRTNYLYLRLWDSRLGNPGRDSPQPFKLLVAHWYENRVPAENDIPLAVKAVLGPYRDLQF